MLKLSTVESFTGGMMAQKITSLPGASRFFKGALVLYTNDIKEKLAIKTDQGVINAQTAIAMSAAGNKFFDTNLCISFTGNAGPDAWENKPVGLVYIAINEQVYEKQFAGSREQVRQQAVSFAWKKIKNLFPD